MDALYFEPVGTCPYTAAAKRIGERGDMTHSVCHIGDTLCGKRKAVDERFLHSVFACVFKVFCVLGEKRVAFGNEHICGGRQYSVSESRVRVRERKRRIAAGIAKRNNIHLSYTSASKYVPVNSPSKIL